MRIANKITKLLAKSKKGKICLCMLFIPLLLTSCGATNETLITSSDNEYETISTYESNEINNPIEQESIETVESEIDNVIEDSIELPEDETMEFAELQVHFIDVGQGDSTLIICDSEAMLIDAGDNNQGINVQNYLQKQDVETLKYVICTHPDADHIGGIDVILYKFDCETIFMTEGEKDTNTYRDVIDTIKSKDYTSTLPVVGEQYSLGDAEFTILAPDKLSSDSNNNSISIVLTHGDNKFLFTGDAEEDEERDILNSGITIDVDVYKVGHHGSRSSSSIELLETITPNYAVISCGEDNSYGHPHAETLNNLRAMGIQVFRTDEQGSIVAISDGTSITWNCAPSDTWQAGESTQNSSDIGDEKTSAPTSAESMEESTSINTPTETPLSVTYICNTNTMKFHYPSCSSVNQMSEKNKLSVTSTRDELISQGYEPCKRCNP